MIEARDLKVKPRDPTTYVVTEPTPPTTALGAGLRSLRRVLIGAPLETAKAGHERLSKTKALAVLSSDALSSTAYATEEILLVLVAVVGLAAFDVLPGIGIAIVALLAIVVFSYRQTIHAYPGGGGAYIVSKENLGRTPSLLAGSALMTDYILTVAVSVSAGVAAITSAITSLYDYRVWLAVVIIALVTLLNLRGVRESGSIFAVPTYMFIASMSVLLVLGFATWAGLRDPAEAPVEALPAAAESITLFLVLRAFSAGCTALTGVEAISDGVPVFKEPVARNAERTLMAMGGVLGVLFLSITALVWHFELVPDHSQTLVSQLARVIVGDSFFYYFIQAATAGILVLAANTAYADFPRLASFLARDRYLPHQLLFRGDRLAFTNGIVLLGIGSAALVVGFSASVPGLIPLYAVGVFLSFTLSQSGMVRYWLRNREPRWRSHMTVNALGAVTTAVVAAIIIITKFVDGAWVVLLILPLFIGLMLMIRGHYERVAVQLRMTTEEVAARPVTWTRGTAAVVPIDSLNQATVRAIDYAEAISDDVTVVHIAIDSERGDTLRQRWEAAHMGVPLVIIHSEFRELIGPLVAFIEQLHDEKGGATMTVVLPEFVVAHQAELLLHNQTAWRLRVALWSHPGIVVANVPYHLDD